MHLKPTQRQQAFTLIEALVVMLIVVALASVTLDFTKDFAFQSRYEVTQDRYEKLKRAIIGRPDALINGQPDISGFVADMGRLPMNIHDLLEANYCLPDRTETGQAACELLTGGTDWRAQATANTTNDLKHGWRGPYLTVTKNLTKPNAFSDGWGNIALDDGKHNYGWDFDSSTPPNLDLQSIGCGGGCSVSEYNTPTLQMQLLS